MMTEAPRTRLTLIVDDDPALLEGLERSFRAAGEHVVAAGSFEEARAALRNHVFDALITDVRLGAFNGLQLAVMARAQHPNVRLIVFSGYDDPVLRDEANVLRAEYLVKPVTVDQLLTLVRQSPAS